MTGVDTWNDHIRTWKSGLKWQVACHSWGLKLQVLLYISNMSGSPCISNGKRFGLSWPLQRSKWLELFKTCRPMVDVSTGMILDLPTHQDQNVRRFKFHFWNIQLTPVTLRKGSRSNRCTRWKVLDISYKLAPAIWLKVLTLLSTSHLKFTLDTMGKWTLTYKIEVKGHSRKKKNAFCTFDPRSLQ